MSCKFFSNCGGCDFLDLSEENYRNLKKDLLNKLNLSPDQWLWVEPNSRRKITLQINKNNQVGFFAKKSNIITEIDSCFVSQKEISDLIPKLQKFLNSSERKLFSKVSITSFDNILDLIFFGTKELDFSQNQRLTEFAKTQNLNISHNLNDYLTPLFQIRKNEISYSNFKIELNSDIFIQATDFGLRNIIKICRNELKTQINVIDLYAGFGAYSFGIIDLVKNITAVEGDKEMTDSINRNAISNSLKNKITTKVQDLFFTPIKAKELNKSDLAIINPPRNGASTQITEIAKSDLNKLIYISCNPKTFKRDQEILKNSNFKINKLIAIDQFYATKHLELVAIFER